MAEAVERRAAGIACLERPGPGPVLVLLHGIGSNARSFTPLIDRLPGFRIIAWNAPGYGGSAPLPGDWPLADDYARALREMLDALDIRRASLLGHSLGTLVAAAFARAFPERVDRLVLAACAAGYRVPQGGALPAAVAARIDDLTRLGPAEFARTRAARLIHDPDRNPELVAKVQDAMAHVDPKGYAQAVRMLASGDLAASLRGVEVPAGFIIGAQDLVTPEAQTLAAAEALGGTPRIERIDGAGHAVYLQKPDAFAAAILRLMGAAPQPNGGTDER
jgi:pimeloyl-ACP methyl ester carboxylesterase